MREDYVSNDEEGAARIEHDREEAYGGSHAGVRLDVTARQTRSKLLSGIARAYGAVPPPRDAQCLCGDGRGAHHGADGEGRCGEPGCGCERFSPNGEEINS